MHKKILIVDDGCINVLALSMYEILTFSLLALALCPFLLPFDHWSQIQSNTDERLEHLSQSTDIYIIQPGLSSALIIRSIAAVLKKKYDDIIAGRAL